MKRTWLVLGVTVALLLPLSAAFGARYRVRATSENRWNPAVVHANAGDVVIWSNDTGRTHTVVSYGRNWSYDRVLESGTRVRKAFNAAGRYKFRCRRHSQLADGQCSGMCGYVLVH